MYDTASNDVAQVEDVVGGYDDDFADCCAEHDVISAPTVDDDVDLEDCRPTTSPTAALTTRASVPAGHAIQAVAQRALKSGEPSQKLLSSVRLWPHGTSKDPSGEASETRAHSALVVDIL